MLTQEEGNIPWVIDNGVGDFETHPEKIAHIIHRWLLPEDQHSKDNIHHMRKRYVPVSAVISLSVPASAGYVRGLTDSLPRVYGWQRQ